MFWALYAFAVLSLGQTEIGSSTTHPFYNNPILLINITLIDEVTSTVRRFFYPTEAQNNSANQVATSLANINIGERIVLTENIVHHWCRVLRANVGEKGILFDGFGGECVVELTQISKKNAEAVLLAHITEDRHAAVMSTIGLVMSRGDRMDYAIQKATELGVTAIQLLSSHHGEVSLKPAQVDKKLLHWQQVAIAACEQCGLNRPPLIIAPKPINDWLQHSTDGAADTALPVAPLVTALSMDRYYHRLYQAPDLRLMLSVPADGQPAMPPVLTDMLARKMPHITLLIGPEGGLSPDERALAQDVGFLPWQIGDRVLRTETAPVVALATLNALSATASASL